MSKYDLSDNQWKAVKDEIAGKTSRSGQPRRDPRELINAINWVARTGSPWCELPEEYGPHTTAYNNFRKWTVDGTSDGYSQKYHPKGKTRTKYSLMERIATERATNEHAIGFIKRFKILSERYGNHRKRFALRLNLLAGICNFELVF